MHVSSRYRPAGEPGAGGNGLDGAKLRAASGAAVPAPTPRGRVGTAEIERVALDHWGKGAARSVLTLQRCRLASSSKNRRLWTGDTMKRGPYGALVHVGIDGSPHANLSSVVAQGVLPI